MGCETLGTIEQEQKFLKLLDENRGQKSQTMVVMQKTQDIYGYLPKITIEKMSTALQISQSEIFGIATFYSQFSLTPNAKYNINICLGTACFVLGSQNILDKVLSKLNLEIGKISEDGKWLVTSCRCLGCCGIAPAMTINEDVYGKLKPEEIDKILDSYK